MPGWTPEELNTIDRTEELDLRSERPDGSLRTPVTIWVVRNGDDVYVRPVKGPDGWHHGALTRHQGSITCGAITKNVVFTEAEGDHALNKALDDAYRTKYARYAENIVGAVTNDLSRSAALRLTPR